MSETAAIRILVVDDHRVVLEGVCSFLKAQSDMEVVGTAGDGRSAIEAARSHRPDVVLLDITMPRLNGLAAIPFILDVTDTRIIGLSVHTSQRIVVETILAGASGYVTKTCSSDEVIAAIRNVAQGRRYLSSDIDEDAIHESISRGLSSANKGVLTAREKEVLQLLSEGKRTKEIATILYLSEHTVNRHRVRIMDKLGLRGVAELTRYAIREGLSPLE